MTGDRMISLQGLVKRYGDVEAVRAVDIDIQPGETVALLGPNGAGKSTTIDMLLGLLRPDAGSVSVFGRTPEQAISAGLVGAMLQTGSLPRDLSVRELVGMMASLYPDPMPVDEVLAVTGADAFADQRTQKLSGGQTQRARAAIALVSNPDLLVLDEPTAAVDVAGRRDFWAVMRRFASSGTTILFATHYLEEADQFADRIILIAGGRIVADGPTGEVKGLVGHRTIRATLPAADGLETLPGVTSVERHGATVILVCADSDAAIRALLERHADVRDIEITGAGLEDAFLELTA